MVRGGWPVLQAVFSEAKEVGCACRPLLEITPASSVLVWGALAIRLIVQCSVQGRDAVAGIEFARYACSEVHMHTSTLPALRLLLFRLVAPAIVS